MTIASLKPYQDSGHFRPFAGNVELAPGIRAVETPGHTPGHASFVLESQGKKLVIWGDILHVAAVQFPQPRVAISFDSDSELAVSQRQKAFANAARQGDLVAAAHVPFPGLGHLRKSGAGYAWIPLEYGAKP